jgi:hypothetical protein
MATEITQIDAQQFLTQGYEEQDTNLLTSFNVNTFLSSSSYIELFVYDNNKNILSSNLNFTQYTVLNNGQSSGDGNNISEIILDPESILIDLGYNQGEYTTYFNFFNKNIGSELQTLYISEISSDRTEVRLDSVDLTNLDIIEQANNFIQERENSSYFLDFYLDFGNNDLILANNVVLDNEDPNNPTILIKLYEPLLEEFNVNSTLWVVSPIEEPIAYQVIFDNPPITIIDTIPLKGPNFNIELKDQINNSTLSLSYNDLITTNLSSSLNQLNSFLEEKELDINVDYTDFTNFIHFSSAITRISNFYYKVQLIEQYSSSISLLNTTTSSSLNVSENKATYEDKINEIITNFDNYEYYLYYSSGSWAYPKLTSKPPYQLAPSDSQITLNWLGSTNESSPLYGGIILSASLYDNQNKDNLLFSIPEYLRDDPDNDGYELFIDMIAQHFDNIWLYYKDVTQKYNADNRLEYGISKDIVADAIRDFGVKLYQNNFSNADLYTAFLGLTPDGALFPFPNITGSLPTPSGFEYVDTLISASNDYLPLDDVNKSLYKRIYHNLPYLLKSKGTLPGLRALITSYGIPDTILRINEYGGKDKTNLNDWDYWQNEFNYAFYTSGSNFITTPWRLNTSWNSPNNVPSTLKFRFKTNSLPTSNIAYSQSLWFNNLSSSITLTYTGSAYSSGSYSGSAIDPYYQYATLTFHPNASSFPNISASLYLPFYDGGWWSVMVNRSGSNFTLHAGNKIYEGGDNGTILGFYASSSIVGSITSWTGSASSSFARGPLTISTKTYTAFSGSLQEIRYYDTKIEENVFKDYIMNPYSIEGNSLNSGPNELAFRASLGGELYTGSVSIHPKITGSWTTTSSFISNSNFNFNSTPVFLPNIEYFFYDQPIAGIKNTVSDKIRLENNTLPSGSVLSPFRSLSQTIEASASYTPNINYLEVAFSPQNEINEDIMDQLGSFNLGEYIGNPNERFSGNSYPNLDNLRNRYFEKYVKNYNLVDFIRLIKFFDNSLFKMIRDFVPARTSLASGVVIKQHLLERNKYPQPQIEWENLDISGTIKSTQVWDPISQSSYISHSLIEEFSGGTAGSFEIFNGINTSPYGADGNGPDNIFGITQSWNETYPTPLGEVTITHDSQEEFYDGEFKGSVILVTTQSLNQPYPLENTSFEYTPILYTNNLYNQLPFSSFTENQFLNSLTVPSSGEMLIMAPRIRRTIGGLFFPKGNAYIKIHKEDCNNNNNSLPLGQISNLLIKYSSSLTYTNYEILNTHEYPTYYLYQISNQNIDPTGSGISNEIKDYKVSASRTTPSFTLTPGNTSAIQSLTESIDNLNYFNPVNGVFTFSNTPNIPIVITASLSLNSNANDNTGSIVLVKNGDVTDEYVGSTELSQTFVLNSGANTVIFTGSFIPLNGDNYYLRLYNGTSMSDFGNITFNSIQLIYTQSISPTASTCDPIILEPYITTPNFYNSDENALLNDVHGLRLSNFYQDVDYSSGVLIPTNFDLLLDEEATKAAVQDSNYSSFRHINPRYNGSKSTSQKLNVWTSGDEGTFGKLPTIESTKIYAAYCDFIGGYPPERMNSSGAHIIYLIKEDGTVVIPNTTENSLEINQGTFESGERISITSKNLTSGEAAPYRNIIRGGTRIEPILYTQLGHSPANFTSSFSLTTDFIQDLTTVGNYTAVAKPSTSPVYIQSSFTATNMNNPVLLGPEATWNNYWYEITQDIILENVTLEFSINLPIYINAGALGAQTHIISSQLVLDRSGTLTVLSSNQVSSNQGSYNSSVFVGNMGLSAILYPQDIQNGDKIYIRTKHTTSSPLGNDSYYTSAASFKVTQIPNPTNTLVTSSGINTIWGYPDNTKLYAITCSSEILNSFYKENFKQVDISGSGFNPISLPWSLEIGDEFRFEGNENNTFMVKKIYDVEETDFERISQTGSLEIHFNNILPSQSIDLDHFLIRRYVDDASLILIEGFKPDGSQGPFIVKPEFSSETLNQNIDRFIVDLTQKGLL